MHNLHIDPMRGIPSNQPLPSHVLLDPSSMSRLQMAFQLQQLLRPWAFHRWLPLKRICYVLWRGMIVLLAVGTGG